MPEANPHSLAIRLASTGVTIAQQNRESSPASGSGSPSTWEHPQSPSTPIPTTAPDGHGFDLTRQYRTTRVPSARRTTSRNSNNSAAQCDPYRLARNESAATLARDSSSGLGLAAAARTRRTAPMISHRFITTRARSRVPSVTCDPSPGPLATPLRISYSIRSAIALRQRTVGTSTSDPARPADPASTGTTAPGIPIGHGHARTTSSPAGCRTLDTGHRGTRAHNDARINRVCDRRRRRSHPSLARRRPSEISVRMQLRAFNRVTDCPMHGTEVATMPGRGSVRTPRVAQPVGSAPDPGRS